MSPRIHQWIGLIAVTGAAQVAVQAIGFVSGILVIRLLPVHEYALYTLANTMLGTMVVLADGGIATGVMAQGGKVWQDKTKLGAVLATGLALRRKFAVYSLLVSVPILLYLLRKHEASWLMSALIVLSLIPAFFSSLSGKLLEIPPKLHQDIKPLQRFQVEANLGRLALMGLTMFVFPFAAVAIACAGVSQVWNNWRLRKASAGYADRAQGIDPDARRHILGVVKRILPGAVYFCLSGQITIWLASTFGTTENVAQIGALGRLMMMMNIISTAFGILIVPRFSRLPSVRKTLFTHFFLVQGLLLLASAFIVTALTLSPESALWVLGRGYEGLGHELVLSAVAGCMTLLYGSTFLLCANRGSVIPPAYNIGISLLSQVVILLIVGHSSLRQILWFSIVSGVVQYVMWTVYFLARAGKIEKTENISIAQAG